MPQYLVVARFEVEEGSFVLLIEEAQKIASASLLDEAGCRRYEVLLPVGSERRGTLYEVYDDKSDHELHK